MGAAERVLVGIAWIVAARVALQGNDVRSGAPNELFLDRYGTTHLHGAHEQSGQLLVSEVFPPSR